MAEGSRAATGLCAGGQAHGRPGDCRHRHPDRRLLAAPVLAGDRRRIHEIHAPDPHRHLVGLARRCPVLHPDARRHARPRQPRPRAGARQQAARSWALHAHRQARRDPPGHRAQPDLAAARRGDQGLWAIRPRGRVFPQYRARLRPRPGQRARQPVDPREGQARSSRRAAAAPHEGDRDRLCPRRRRSARFEPGHRGHRRHRPVRVRRLEGAAPCQRHHGRDPRHDQGHPGRGDRGDEAGRRARHRQADHPADLRRRSGAPVPGGPQGGRHRPRESATARRR